MKIINRKIFCTVLALTFVISAVISGVGGNENWFFGGVLFVITAGFIGIIWDN